MTVNNYDRADFARRTLEAYRRIVRGDMETALGDLLGDLRHYCDLQGLDFAKVNKRAHHMYLTELEEDGGPCQPEEY